MLFDAENGWLVFSTTAFLYVVSFLNYIFIHKILTTLFNLIKQSAPKNVNYLNVEIIAKTNKLKDSFSAAGGIKLLIRRERSGRNFFSLSMLGGREILEI
jgi:hypothetical protein